MPAEEVSGVQGRPEGIQKEIRVVRNSATSNAGTGIPYCIMADTIAKIADIEKEIDQQSSELVEAQNEAFRYLDQIPSESANYLINRFFVGMTITDIGRLTFSSERSTYRRVQNALAEFQAVLDRNDVVQ